MQVLDRTAMVIFAALFGAWIVLAVLLLLVRRLIHGRGRRCPRCLRPWDAEPERGWGALEVAARRERRRDVGP